FELRVCVENHLAHAILSGCVAGRGTQQCEAAPLAIDRVAARRERDVSAASGPAFPHGKANQLQAVEEPFGEMQFGPRELAGQRVLVAWCNEFDDHGVLHMLRRLATRPDSAGWSGPQLRSAWRHNAGQWMRRSGERSAVGRTVSTRGC